MAKLSSKVMHGSLIEISLCAILLMLKELLIQSILFAFFPCHNVFGLTSLYFYGFTAGINIMSIIKIFYS